VVGLIGMTIYFIPSMVARLLYATQIEAMSVDNPGDISYAFMVIAFNWLIYSGIVTWGSFAVIFSNVIMPGAICRYCA